VKHTLIAFCLVIFALTGAVEGWFALRSSNDDLEQVLSSLTPKQGRSALLLGFDTDDSDDAASYAQYYDDFEKQAKKKPTNRTLFLVREGDNLRIASSLDLIASPQSNGWLFLGQARYFESKPRDKNEHLDRLEKEGSLQNFAFDYSRVWMTNSHQMIPVVKRQLIAKTTSEINREYRKLPKGEREYHRNITDYEKIGWVANGFYIADGYWSQIHGGAAWFEAREYSRLVNIDKGKLSGNLDNWISKKQIIEKYQADFDSERRNSPDAKFNDMDWTWNRWLTAIGGDDTDRIPTFMIERQNARTTLIGRVLVDGNMHRSFMLSADFGDAPKKLVRYDNPPIDFEKLKKFYPTLIDIYVSPDQSTVIALTDKEFIALDVFSKREVSRIEHNVIFNKVVMVEWATGEYVEKWIRALNK